MRDDFSVYDAAYIALAQALDAPLVTADSKLAPASRHAVEVVVMGG